MTKIIRIKELDIELYYFNFQGYKLNLSDLVLECQSEEFMELLPSIYVKKQKVNQIFRRKILKWMQHQEQCEYIIDCRNIRDYFSVKKMGDEYIQERIYTENTYVPTKTLPYPGLLGEGCEMLTLFDKIGLCSNDGYEPLSVSEVLKVSAQDEELKYKICLNGKCNKFIKKMLDDTFETYFNQDEVIKINCCGGKYELIEGKHRICAAKRFGLDTIPVEVTHCEKKSEPYKTIQNPDISSAFPVGIRKDNFCAKIMEDCYKKYEKIGLSREQVRYLNENVSDEMYLTYLKENSKIDFYNIE